MRIYPNLCESFIADLFIASGWPNGGDIDGFTFQDLAVKHGLLLPETRTEPCGEACHCVEYHDDMSEGVTCYRMAEWLIAAVRRKAACSEVTNEINP